ncbi:BT_3928 family protein [Parafilimonas sp.]|uniref:BT_3928 family protein n=1 Tax=Parafilimonas sp. TaxID=1969739 RepID=UPI0039E64785
MAAYKKNILLVIRWFVGLLFIFSGLVKANDPLGLSYKMQEFFEVWNMYFFNDYTLSFSLIMNVFEVLAGVAVIIGWHMRLFSWLLLLLIIFFSFLTGYALFSGKIKTCGCFGDCLPLTPAQSFTKDLILLLLILVLFVNRKKILSSVKPVVAVCLLIFCIAVISELQAYVMKHLPVVDCLPYKKGNNLVQQMQPPPNAVPDSIVMVFRYKKNGEVKEYTAETLPADLDSTYEFINRVDKVIRKGNATPPIADFALFTLGGTDTTKDILQSGSKYVMLFAKDFSTFDAWMNDDFKKYMQQLQRQQIHFYIITADKQGAEKVTGGLPADFLLCDGTVIKTAARVNPTYFVMHGADVIDKFSYADLPERLHDDDSKQ